MVDFFKVLGVSYEAGQEEIQRAFRSRVKELHPDTGVYDPELYSQLVEAYQFLSAKRGRLSHLRKLKEINPLFHPRGFVSLKNSRLVYPNRLEVILKKIKVFDKKRYHEASASFQEDLYVFLKPDEAGRGVFFSLYLPIRQVCPECRGNQDDCHLCEGKRSITSSYPARFELAPVVMHGELFILRPPPKPFNGAYYLTNKLKVRALVAKNILG